TARSPSSTRGWWTSTSCAGWRGQSVRAEAAFCHVRKIKESAGWLLEGHLGASKRAPGKAVCAAIALHAGTLSMREYDLTSIRESPPSASTCAKARAFQISPILRSGSLTARRRKNFSIRALWKASKPTDMPFGTWIEAWETVRGVGPKLLFPSRRHGRQVLKVDLIRDVGSRVCERTTALSVGGQWFA